ncbi:DUF6159 family protein [Streptomyces abikoensis]|uniref:DUF6159 family protein n=1 Tax=Streptomyces abikoensis TaxID=97398 RepID=UPI00371E6393
MRGHGIRQPVAERAVGDGDGGAGEGIGEDGDEYAACGEHGTSSCLHSNRTSSACNPCSPSWKDAAFDWLKRGTSDGRPTIRASLGAMLRRMPVLACWSVLGNSIGVLLRIAESTVGVSWLFDMAGLSWSLLTYFALPVLVAEGAGLLTTLRRSLALGRRELGAQLAGFTRVLLTTVLVAFVGVAALILAVETDDVAIMLAAAGGVIVLWLLVGIASSTLSGIYRMTLYHRASATPLPPTLPRHSTLPAAQVGFRP